MNEHSQFDPPDDGAADVGQEEGLAPEPAEAPAAIAERLRRTEAEGVAYLLAQRLDRAGLLDVAAALGITRVERLTRARRSRSNCTKLELI